MKYYFKCPHCGAYIATSAKTGGYMPLHTTYMTTQRTKDYQSTTEYYERRRCPNVGGSVGVIDAQTWERGVKKRV